MGLRAAKNDASSILTMDSNSDTSKIPPTTILSDSHDSDKVAKKCLYVKG